MTYLRGFHPARAAFASVPRSPGVSSALALAFACVAFAADKKANYDDDVRPIFAEHCLGCHNADKKKADLDLTTFSAMSQGSVSGKVVEGGDPDKSLLYLFTAHKEEPHMPPNKARIPDKQLDVLKRWIEQGALENAGATAAEKPKNAITAATPGVYKPKGTPIMPGPLPLEPVESTARPNTVIALAHSPYAPLVALGGIQQIVLYNSDTLEPLGILPFPDGSPTTMTFSRTGALLLAGGGTGAKIGRTVIYDVATGKRLATLGQDYDTVLGMDLNAEQSLLATGGPDKLVKVLNTSDGKQRYAIKKHTDWVLAVAFSPDGVLLASGDRNGGLYVWEAKTGENLYELRGHTGAITALSWRSDSNVLASASEDGSIKLWDITTGNLAKSTSVHRGGALDVAFGPDGRLVSAGRDRYARVLGADGSSVTVSGKESADIATRAVFNHDGKRFIAADWTGAVTVFDAADGKKLGDLSANPPTLAQRIAAAKLAADDARAKLQSLATADEAAKAEQTPKLQAQIAAFDKDVERWTAAQAFAKRHAAEAANQPASAPSSEKR